MTSPTRLSCLSRLLTFLNRPASSASLPPFTKTALKIEAISLIGALIYTLAKARTGELRDKDGRPNMGVFVMEAIEEGRDRLEGRNESSIEMRKQERRDARKKVEEQMRERVRRHGKKGVVLLRWGWPKKP